MLREFEAFNDALGLHWRIHWSEVPGTKRPGDRLAWSKYNKELASYYARSSAEFSGPIADATLQDMGLRALVINTIMNSRAVWDKL